MPPVSWDEAIIRLNDVTWHTLWVDPERIIPNRLMYGGDYEHIVKAAEQAGLRIKSTTEAAPSHPVSIHYQKEDKANKQKKLCSNTQPKQETIESKLEIYCPKNLIQHF
jgi:hypothetical protein